MTNDPVLGNTLDRAQYPLQAAKAPQTQTFATSEDWRDLREYWYGRPRDALARLLASRWDPEVGAKAVKVCRDLIQWGRRHKAPSTLRNAPWIYSGDAATIALLTEYREAVATAMAVATLAGCCWLHLAKRRGKLRLEVLWGDQVTFVMDPMSPADLQACTEIKIVTVAGGTLYRRDLATGAVAVYAVDSAGKEIQIGTAPDYPVIGLYSQDHDMVQPGMRTVWLDAQKQIDYTLTDVEHHREKMPGQRYVTGIEASDTAQIAMGPGALLCLNTSTGQPVIAGQLIAPVDMISKMLEAVENTLKFLAVTEGIPPESISITSQAQTGAAMAVTVWPEWDLRIESWQSCLAWLMDVCQWLAVVGAGDGLGVATVTIPKPEQPKLGDPRSYEQAAQMRVDRGIETVEEQREAEAERDGNG